jgi:hypothetical protein
MSTSEEFKILNGKLQELVEKLNKQLGTLKKNPNRCVKQELLIKRKEKLEKDRQIFNNTLKEINNKFKLKDDSRNIIENLRQSFATNLDNLILLLHKRAREEETEQEKDLDLSLIFEETDETNCTMSVFSYETAMRLPVLEIIKDTNVRDFLNNVEGYYDILNDAGKILLISLVVKTKIQGTAKTRLGDNTARTFDELKKIVVEHCSSTETVESLQKKIQDAKQGKQTAEQFAEELEDIANKMAIIEIKNNGILVKEAREAIFKICKGQALTAFQQGLENGNVRTAVVASRAKSLTDALQVAVAAKAANVDNEVKVETLYAYANQNNRPVNRQANRNTFQGVQGDARSGLDCYVCGRKGHFARNCYEGYQNRARGGGQGYNRGGQRGQQRGQGYSRGGQRGQYRGQGYSRGGQRGPQMYFMDGNSNSGNSNGNDNSNNGESNSNGGNNGSHDLGFPQ